MGERRANAAEELQALLDAAVARHIEVTWKWVPGHADSVENNRVDVLAGQARRMAMEQVAT